LEPFSYRWEIIHSGSGWVLWRNLVAAPWSDGLKGLTPLKRLHEAPPDDTPPSKDPLDKVSEESPSWFNHHPKGYIA
jgi:hypothetical protein